LSIPFAIFEFTNVFVAISPCVGAMPIKFTTFKLTYVDSGDDKITIMEQDDLDVAYAIAIGGSMKLKFNIELVSDKVF
jgi:hypothetical protein